MPVRLLFIAFLVFISAEALANSTPKPLNKTWQTKWFAPSNNNDPEAVVWIADGFELNGDFKTWYLLGEPVINCTARWTNSAKASVTVPSSSQNLIETAQEGEVELYNLMLAYIAPDPRYSGGNENQIVLFCDAGIVAQNGRKGFNVAGSPSWDKFICTVEPGYKDIRIRFKDDDLCKSIGGNWLNAANAKSVAISGLDSRKTGLWNGETKVLKGEVNGMSVIKRVEKRLWREKSARFKQQRTRAYFDNFPRRPGENVTSWTNRKQKALSRLPNLPIENPTANQLKTYEALWKQLLSENSFSPELTIEWTAKEKVLVDEQFIRIHTLTKVTAVQKENYSRYFAKLQMLKGNEPKQIDPMADYRTATLFTYEQNSGPCGLKTTDGTTVASIEIVPGAPGTRKCFADQLHSNYGIYAIGARQRDGRWSVELYDNNGKLLHKHLGDSNYGIPYSSTGIPFGIFIFKTKIDEPYFVQNAYSLLEQKIVYSERTRYSLYISIRNGRHALGIPSPSSACKGTNNLGFSYFYLDTKKIEDVAVCINPKDDPSNEMIKY